MRFIKTIFLSLFIGFYFLSITPMHFYAHDFESNHSSTQALDDCSYINLLNFGQGNFLHPNSLDFILLEISSANKLSSIDYSNQLISGYLPFYYNLRAPPF